MSDPDLGSPSAAARQTPGRPSCSSFAAGHGAHPLRVQLCDAGTDDEWAPVVVMGAVDDVVTLAEGQELRRFRNHAPGRLLQLVGEAGPDAMLNRRYGLLFLRSWPRDRAAVFSLQPADDPAGPCRP